MAAPVDEIYQPSSLPEWMLQCLFLVINFQLEVLPVCILLTEPGLYAHILDSEEAEEASFWVLLWDFTYKEGFFQTREE